MCEASFCDIGADLWFSGRNSHIRFGVFVDVLVRVVRKRSGFG